MIKSLCNRLIKANIKSIIVVYTERLLKTVKEIWIPLENIEQVACSVCLEYILKNIQIDLNG